MDPGTIERLKGLLHPGRLPGDRRIDAADRNAIADALAEIASLGKQLTDARADLRAERTARRQLVENLGRLVDEAGGN